MQKRMEATPYVQIAVDDVKKKLEQEKIVEVQKKNRLMRRNNQLLHANDQLLAAKSLSLCIEPVLIITSVGNPTLSVFFCLWPSLWGQAHTFPKQHPKEKHPINAKASAGQHNNILSLRLGPLPKLSKQQTLSKDFKFPSYFKVQPKR